MCVVVQDVILSVLNAAMSTFAVYNTMDKQIDQQMVRQARRQLPVPLKNAPLFVLQVRMFGKFHQAISLINGADDLQRGVFYIVVKDILNDQADVHAQYRQHLNQILAQPKNFIETVSARMWVVNEQRASTHPVVLVL